MLNHFCYRALPHSEQSRATNRLSGFLTNLIHRRTEREQPQSSRPVTRDERENSKGEESSRASSPQNRPLTPPPSLPAPSLQDLGLCLSAITSILTPSHFSSPPTSGTFMAPHYLLLCHSQGLDVLPLVGPPAPQPYALVRRVSFKCVVIMEERGVLVAIAGRRDGVRVYALAEVKKAVEWRIDVEIRREKDRLRRETSKRNLTGGVDKVFGDLKIKASENEKIIKARLGDSPTTPTPSTKTKRRKSSAGNSDSTPKPLHPRPRPPTIIRKTRTPTQQTSSSIDDTDPPPYRNISPSRPDLQNQPSVISVSQGRSRSGSVSDMLAGNSHRRRSVYTAVSRDDEKGDWEHASSDDEAINMVTAGPSGSAALDERTSSMGAMLASASVESGPGSNGVQIGTGLQVPAGLDSLHRSQTSSAVIPSLNRRNRPAQLDLGASRPTVSTSAIPRPPPSPTPTIWTLRQALAAIPPTEGRSRSRTPDGDPEDDDDEGGAESITFEQMLMESRLPGIPPPGSRQPQEAILIGGQERVASPDEESLRETMSDIHTVTSNGSIHTPTPSMSRRGRRRWSILGGAFSQLPNSMPASISSQQDTSSGRPQTSADGQVAERPSTAITRVNSSDTLSILRGQLSHGPTLRPTRSRVSTANSATLSIQSSPSAHHRFLPRIISNAFNTRRSDDQPSPRSSSHNELSKKPSGNSLAPIPPAPKLEYYKLPGTKGTVMIKAIETAKKRQVMFICYIEQITSLYALVFLPSSVAKTVRRSNSSLVLIVQLWDSPARLYYRILLVHWNFNFKEMI